MGGSFIRLRVRAELHFPRCPNPLLRLASLTQSRNPRLLEQGRFLLAFCELFCPLPVKINATELFAVCVSQGYQPVMVFAAAILLGVSWSAFGNRSVPPAEGYRSTLSAS